MNNPFDYIPAAECDEAYRKLISRISSLKSSGDARDLDFLKELEEGKMLGVLIAADGDGVHQTLYAFSGQLGDCGFSYPGFVGAAFDYLRPDGYFKTREADIIRQSGEITRFENEVLKKISGEYQCAKTFADAEVTEAKGKMRMSRLQRESRRKSGMADEEELAAMIRQSQFEKAELHRLKKKLAEALKPLAAELKEAQYHLDSLREKRRRDSEALQEWLFTNFRLLNARGDSKSLRDIFAGTSMKIPPSGAGECCAPKLLHAAYTQGLQPIAIAEYWFGTPKRGEVRIPGMHYPACRGKCLPVLEWMLRGLTVTPPLDTHDPAGAEHTPRIIYEDQWICAVDKPGGMLSVPGKGNSVSLQQWLSEKYGSDRDVKVAHRLDQDTSGIIIATFGETAYRTMQRLFATREVMKTYVADLDGDYRGRRLTESGRIDLPLSPDWLDRPRQRVDPETGKPAVTDYRFMGVDKGLSRVIFHPLTGRTHQLRVHSASEAGLGMPIAGDRLYGMRRDAGSVERLHLHAQRIEFTFPINNRIYVFESPVPF